VLWAVLLAAIAGYVDAITFLRLGEAFAANMPGNLVEVGIRAATGEWLRAVWCASLLLAFLAGVLAARLILQAHRSPRLSLLIVSGIIAVAGTGIFGGAATAVLAAAMAIQNEVVRDGIVAINVAFITGDLQQLASRLLAATAPMRRPDDGGPQIIVAVLACYALGAGIGTLAAGWDTLALLVPGAVLAGATLLPIRWTGLAARRV